MVEEPSVEATIAILRGLQEKYEVHHGVDITDPAIVAAAELSRRYITDRFLPDKAIDLIDEAAARIKMEIDSKPEAMDRLDRRIIQLKIEREAIKKEKDEASQKRLTLIESEIKKLEREYADLEEVWKAEKAAVQGSQHIKEELEKLKLEMEAAKRKGDWQKVSELQYGRMPQLEAQLKKAEKTPSAHEKPKLLRTQVGAEEIAEVVSRATGIPVSKMMQGERDKLLAMEEKLHERVVGQDEAVHLVADAIRRSRAGLSDPNRPYGSFLFLGPTGVGKTELCKALTAFLFDSEDHLNRIDEIVVFHALDEKHIRSIAKIQLRYLEERLAKLEIRLEVGDSALEQLAKAGFDPVYGARPLKRAIQQSIENPLAKQILEGRFAAKDIVRVEYRNGAMQFEKALAKSAQKAAVH